MSTEVTAPALDPTQLPDDADVLKQMVAELLATVTQLRTTIDKQQAHVRYLVRLTFGRRSERVEGPTLFDLSAPAEEAMSAPPPDVPGPTVVGKHRGHGRRPRRADLPREREVLDLTEAGEGLPVLWRSPRPHRRRRVQTPRLPPGLFIRPCPGAADLPVPALRTAREQHPGRAGAATA
jgi:hypothetical protein